LQALSFVRPDLCVHSPHPIDVVRRRGLSYLDPFLDLEDSGGPLDQHYASASIYGWLAAAHEGFPETSLPKRTSTEVQSGIRSASSRKHW
jgi:hypothetical protein